METGCVGVDAKMNTMNGSVDKLPEIHSDRKVLLDGTTDGW
jgi:hypothetical protein